MQLRPRDFWRLTLAEWRGMQKGHEKRERERRHLQAWATSWQLVAAGCEADKVTPARLLGEKERRKSRGAKPADKPVSAGEVWEQFQRLGEERRQRVAEIGEEAVKAEEEAALKKARDAARRRFEREG